MKKTLFLMIALLFLPLCFAQDYGGQQYETTRIWANYEHNPSVTSANIFIYSPNGSIIATNQSMLNYSATLKYFEFTPNEVGNYVYFIHLFNILGVEQQHTEGALYVQGGDMAVAIIFGLVAIICFFLYMGFDLIQKQPLPIFGPGYDKIKITDLGLFFLMLSFPMVNLLLAVMQKMTTGATYNNLINIVFQVSIYITILAISLYVIFYIIMRNIAQTKNILSLQKAGRK